VRLAFGENRLSLSRAMFAAKYGQPLEPPQLELLNYYIYWPEMKKVIQHQKTPPLEMLPDADQARLKIWMEGIPKAMAIFEKQICDIFLEAVRTHNRQKIIELADAVWFFRDKVGDNTGYADADRYGLLLYKHQAEHFGLRLTMRELAKFVAENTQRKFQPSEDGYSSLRKKAKELKVPIVVARKGKLIRKRR
jgi:hypothetical protein